MVYNAQHLVLSSIWHITVMTVYQITVMYGPIMIKSQDSFYEPMTMPWLTQPHDMAACTGFTDDTGK